MQLKVGDAVVHPVYGVGEIINIEEKRFSGIDARLYYKIALLRSTIWIPIEAQATVGLRLVTPKSELDQYRDLLKSPPASTGNALSQGQHMELDKRLKKGSFPVMCEVVRDLTALDWKKPLGATGKTILRKAQEKLYQEWAMAAGISIAEATKEIDALLMSNRQAYNVG